MSELPGDLLFTTDHEWLRREADGSVTIGITDHAATALGDLVYVELPEVGQDVDAGGDDMEVTVAVTNGTLTLAGTAGLTFTSGDGTADATMTFTGSAAEIESASARKISDRAAIRWRCASKASSPGRLPVWLLKLRACL